MIDVSVIVPAYNEEILIESCINSIIESGIYAKCNFEIVIVNDGSKDNTVKKVKKYISNNIKLINKKNEGKGSAQNVGIANCKGSCILITDADVVVDIAWMSKFITDLKHYDMVIGSCFAYKPRSLLEKIQNSRYLILFKYHGIVGLPSVGANLGFNATIINKIGMFSQTKTSVTSDFITKAKKRNLNIKYNPKIIVYTKITKNILIYIKQKLRWRQSYYSKFSLSYIYTYILSYFLFFGTIYFMISNFMILPLFIIFIYLFSNSIYYMPMLKMIKDNNVKNIYYYFLYGIIELFIRYLIIPYKIYLFINMHDNLPIFDTKR